MEGGSKGERGGVRDGVKGGVRGGVRGRGVERADLVYYTSTCHRLFIAMETDDGGQFSPEPMV